MPANEPDVFDRAAQVVYAREICRLLRDIAPASQQTVSRAEFALMLAEARERGLVGDDITPTWYAVETLCQYVDGWI